MATRELLREWRETFRLVEQGRLRIRVAFEEGNRLLVVPEVATGLKMSAMNVGPISCAKNLLVAFAPGNVDIPTTSVVIEHPKHGLVLWDTGINEAVARRRLHQGNKALKILNALQPTDDVLVTRKIDVSFRCVGDIGVNCHVCERWPSQR